MPKFEGPVSGAPCWVDITVGNMEGVKPFYNALFGWEFTDQGEQYGHYNVISVGDDVVGGAMQYVAEYMGPDEINAWSIYFASDDAAAMLKAVEEYGGNTVSPAMQVGDQGTMAVATDSTGASFGIWQPDARRGYDKWGEHGFPGWFELHTRNFDTATGFYGTVLGAEVKAEDMGGDGRYSTLYINDEPQAGILDAAPFMPDGASNFWAPYFIVDDTDAAISTANGNGGALLWGPEDSPHGRAAMLQDPSGASFFVISGDEG